MAELTSTVDASHGELLLHTGVAGRAAKMGHRLTIAMTAWQAAVSWSGDRPTAVRVDVEVESLQVRRGEGGLTPLSAPEKILVRSNALKCLDARRFPQIRFECTDVTRTDAGYRLVGALQLHGRTVEQTVTAHVDDADGAWRLHCEAVVRHSDHGIKPFSMLMGSMQVADAVAVACTATVRAPVRPQ